MEEKTLEQFQKVVESQLARIEAMKAQGDFVDYAKLDKIIIGGLIILVPGVPFTSSIRDFFNGDYLSGTIRLIDALLVSLCMAIGVGAVHFLFM